MRLIQMTSVNEGREGMNRFPFTAHAVERGLAYEYETALKIFDWIVTASLADMCTDGFASPTELTD
jgi:hypothetical protein